MVVYPDFRWTEHSWSLRNCNVQAHKKQPGAHPGRKYPPWLSCCEGFTSGEQVSMFSAIITALVDNSKVGWPMLLCYVSSLCITSFPLWHFPVRVHSSHVMRLIDHDGQREQQGAWTRKHCQEKDLEGTPKERWSQHTRAWQGEEEDPREWCPRPTWEDTAIYRSTERFASKSNFADSLKDIPQCYGLGHTADIIMPRFTIIHVLNSPKYKWKDKEKVKVNNDWHGWYFHNLVWKFREERDSPD